MGPGRGRQMDDTCKKNEPLLLGRDGKEEKEEGNERGELKLPEVISVRRGY